MGRMGMIGMMDWMGRWWDWGGWLLAPTGTGATEQERHHWLDGYCKQGTNGTDGLDGVMVGQGWDGRLLAPAGTVATEQERHHWLAGYCKQGTNGTDGLDGAMVGQGWDGQTLAGVGTGAPPWAPEQERHRLLLRGSALCKVVVATNIVGAEYLCWISKTIHIECTQIRTSYVQP